jgi:hypothetical protein
VTIAACYVTPEGVVLGADSTASMMLGGGFHYFNFNQKVFEVSDEPGKGTIGIVTWGLGSFGAVSHRTLTALLDDDLKAEPPSDLAEVATRRCDIVWPRYTPLLARCHALAGKSPFDKNSPPNPSARTEAEEIEFDQWKRGYSVTTLEGISRMPWSRRLSASTSILSKENLPRFSSRAMLLPARRTWFAGCCTATTKDPGCYLKLY